jgi:cell division transport system permease protein
MKSASHHKQIGSYPQWSVITTVAITLFMIGLFSLFALYAGKLTDILKASIDVQVYINRNLSLQDSLTVQEKLLNCRFIEQKNGKPQYTYITKEEAAKRMIAESGEDFIAFLGENPLRDAYSLQIKSEFQAKEQLKIIKAELEAIDGVFEVAYTESFINEINQNISKIGLIIGILVFISLVTVVIIINNAIRLALFSQRFLIRSMQLVGATAFFIKKPFLWRATLQGIIGGFLAIMLLSFVIILTHSQIPELDILRDWLSVGMVYVSLLVGGFVICSISAYIAVTRYLRMSLDELY